VAGGDTDQSLRINKSQARLALVWIETDAILSLDSARCQAALQLALRDVKQDHGRDGRQHRAGGKLAPALAELLADEQAQAHGHGVLLRVGQHDRGQQVVAVGADEAEHEDHGQHRPHQRQDDGGEGLPGRGAVQHGRLVQVARHRVEEALQAALPAV